MVDEHLKIADIARITGVPESEVREIIQKNRALFKYREIGKVRIFTPGAVETVRKLTAAGDKAKRKNAAQVLAKEPGETHVKPAPAPQSSIDLVPERVSPTAGHAIEISRLQDLVARQQRSIERLRSRLEELQAQYEMQKDLFEEENARLERSLELEAEAINSINDWVKYFDGRMDAMDKSFFDRLRERLKRD